MAKTSLSSYGGRTAKWVSRVYIAAVAGTFLLVAVLPRDASLGMRMAVLVVGVALVALFLVVDRVDVVVTDDELTIQNAFRRYEIPWDEIDEALAPAQAYRPVWTSLIFSYGILMRWGLSPRIRLRNGEEIPAVAIRCGIPKSGDPEGDVSLVRLNEVIRAHQSQGGLPA